MSKVLKIGFIISFFAFSTVLYAQNVVVKRKYYDLRQTKLKAEWQQTANGYTNGFYREYFPNGQLYIDRVVKTLDVYPYWGIDLKWKEYTESGDLKWSIAQNEKREFQGEQISYMFSGPKLVKRCRAVFQSGKLNSFELYRKNGTKSLDLNTKSYYKTYDENGNLWDDVKINSKGEFTGRLYQDGYEIVVEALDGKIQKVYERTPDPKNGDWHVYRIGNDTLVSTAKNGNTYFKKFYIDTVRVGLIDKPNINIEITQYQNNEFGLDFVNPAFLCCALSQKYSYDIKFYNRSLQTFVREEVRDIVTDRLIAIYLPEKDIYYHENGQIKKILLAKDDWEEFDENGKLINSYEISCLANYEKNYNIVHAQKLKYLRNSYGWNKLVIDLVEYRKNKHNFIVYNDGNYSYNPNVPFKIQDKNRGQEIFMNQKEADALKNLLQNREYFISSVSTDGNDYAQGLFDNVKQEGNHIYNVGIKNEYKNIYTAYSICVNHILDSLTNLIIDTEPQIVLSPKWKSPKDIDIKTDLEIVQELSKENFSDKMFDFNYIPSEWVEYNSKYLNLINSYDSIVGLFNSCIQKNPKKANKKLKDKTDLNEILLILKSIKVNSFQLQ